MLRRTRRLCPPLLAAAASALVVSSLVSGPAAGPVARPVTEASTRLVSTAHPTNAGAVFDWGRSAWDDEFTEPGGRVRSTWHLNRPGLVSLQHGQLTLNTASTGNVVATATDQSATSGRWEARVRSRQYSPGTQYEVNWELVPVKGAGFHCGAQSIHLAAYHPGDRLVRGSVHALPDYSFKFRKPLDLGLDVYHTYAVEVTDTHISWFVDTHVIRTERRPEALSGVELAPQFRMQQVKGAHMARSRMQMDWVRYYTLAHGNKRSVDAPQMHATRSPEAC